MIRFPAEWEPQSAVLIAWPHHTGDFHNHLESVENTYAIIAKTVAKHQKLLIVCRDDSHEQHIKNLIVQHPNIIFLIASVNDIWVRDTVFLTVENGGKPQLLNFRFNGWGNKYPHQEDNALNHKLKAQFPFTTLTNHKDIDYILEGGSVESDGNGSLMTTRQCLLNPNRNKTLIKPEIEGVLAQYFGVTRFLWLDQDNLSGDDTDAHIDTLARFCSSDTIAYTSCDDHDNPHYPGLKRMETQLEAFRDYNNTPYKLVALPLPKPIYDDEGRQLPANYANFLIINSAVLVPVYDDPMDNVAIDRLATCFADRTVIPIPCRPLVGQYGSLHCMTMQFPRNVFL